MFQEFALFPHLTIIENVAFGLTSWTAVRLSAKPRLVEARVGLTDYANSIRHHLSGGEQQRVALARAIVPRPAVMLMDEPFSRLGPKAARSDTSRNRADPSRDQGHLNLHNP